MSAFRFAMCAAGGFFLAGLLAGTWKYLTMHRDPDGHSRPYVDFAHRASLLYAFACALLGELARASAWSNQTNLVAISVMVVFFAITVVSYVVHALLRDTDNQMRRPHRLGRAIIPTAMMASFMVALVLAELAGFAVLFSGFLAAG